MELSIYLFIYYKNWTGQIIRKKKKSGCRTLLKKKVIRLSCIKKNSIRLKIILGGLNHLGVYVLIIFDQ